MEEVFLFLMGLAIIIWIWMFIIYYIVVLYKLIKDMLE